MALFHPAGFLYSLKGVTERAVTKVVKQGCNDCHFCSWYVVVFFAYLSEYHLIELPGGMKHTNAMRKPSMGSAGKYIFRNTKLLDTTKTLKLWCVQ